MPLPVFPPFACPMYSGNSTCAIAAAKPPRFSPPVHSNPAWPSVLVSPSAHKGIMGNRQPYWCRTQEASGQDPSWQFRRMKELLTDNMSLISQLETVQGLSPAHMLGPARPRLREVSSLVTWCYCFMGYMAIRSSDPTTRNQLA